MPVNPDDGYLEKRLMFTNSSGGVTIRLYKPEKIPSGVTEDAFFATEIIKCETEDKCVDAAVALNKSDLPTDYEFRDAWTRQGNGVVVDLGKVKTIQAMRVSSVAETAARKATTPAEKARIRELAETLNVGNLQTVEAVRNKWPAELEKIKIRPS